MVSSGRVSNSSIFYIELELGETVLSLHDIKIHVVPCLSSLKQLSALPYVLVICTKVHNPLWSAFSLPDSRLLWKMVHRCLKFSVAIIGGGTLALACR